MNFNHKSVFLKEIIKYLNINNIRSDGVYLDCTFGCGGHTKFILNKLSSKGRIIAIDKDYRSNFFCKKIFDKRLIFVNTSFINLDIVLNNLNIKFVDGILIDLGISSFQLNNFKRGFSFDINGPLDMRIDNTSGFSAFDFLFRKNFKFILNIFKKYSNDKFFNNIAKNIYIRNIINNPIYTTFDLFNLIKNSYKEKIFYKKYCVKTFQAIRVFVNNEIEELKICLNKSFDKINTNNGVILIISFNSLESSTIKKIFFLKKFPFNYFNNCNVSFFSIKYKSHDIILNRSFRSAILHVLRKI